MRDWKATVQQMFTLGTAACAAFCAVLGVIFAVLCLTIGPGPAVLIAVCFLIGAFIGGVRDKKAFIRDCLNFFHRDENDY